ncbi:CST complex subunit STN1 isoform X1 [Protopterus annectens]|uniref:CST complex subunit STN1 isoform X1 n=1 Tax=Protopterus annectens TaxID=7888 RepID=UPI001CF9D0E5|nr:CST complex subunit STN1 isoform X1 [Protopterus annectens]XP_043912039.1 CST complex subunit STN1 isoform X1 [Protopterus annectens]XP_043912040.1 CST complex subunit STN1 isoform X1 [Protopterus annectens]XP_043912041.1 CST complex subunit STN1 isoform X1 [Protopterus annectens]
MHSDFGNDEELPSLLWGLDPIFSAYTKLYIKDILEIKESKHIPGIFFYNSHPISKVDVFGTVVLTREKDHFYTYGGDILHLIKPETAVTVVLWRSVWIKTIFLTLDFETTGGVFSLIVDDGTGVISCTCWKNIRPNEGLPTGISAHQTVSGGLNIAEQLRKLQEHEQKNSKLDIGDVIQVRGQIKVFRGQREVVAQSYSKVDDPVFAVQIARMLEVPSLYRNFYDKQFQTHQVLENDSHLSRGQEVSNVSVQAERLSEKISDFLQESNIENFYQRELEIVDSLTAFASKPLPSSSSAVQEYLEPGTTGRQIRSLFREALLLLQQKGVVFQKATRPDEVYLVTDKDKVLHKVILNTIQEDCKREKYAEKGCHFLHIFTCARQAYSPYLTSTIVKRVLDKLESGSDIVSTMEGYYTAF